MVSYYDALACNLQHYVDRGHSLSHALLICLRDEAEVFRVYNVIQAEKSLPQYNCNALLVDIHTQVQD